MNKEYLEALENLKELDKCLISDMRIKIDEYDESNYSMSYEYIDFNGEGLQFNDDLKEEKMIDFIREKKISTIKQVLIKTQKLKKVLEIIKKKNVDIPYLIFLLNSDYNNSQLLKIYNNNRGFGKKLTKEEFALLRMWILDDTNL